jgi:N-acetylneuraminic acid mutarotase
MHRAFLFLLLSASLGIAAPPPLPTPLTSFGAASTNGYSYVFGGHMGKAHEYSTATASGSLRRLSLTELHAWEDLPGAIALQSTGVTAWNGKIYLIGGMQPQNEPGQPSKLVSMSEAAVFDPEKRAWTDLPSLPEPRSSHAVAVLEGKLYAVGGWPLHVGVPEPEGGKTASKKYHDTMAVLELAHPDAGWKTLPESFKRRALAAAAFKGKIWCLGGMTEDNELSAEVDVYDLATNQWSKGPDVPGDQVKGFGCAALATADALYLSPAGKQIYRLSADGKNWDKCAKLAKGRYFHQLVPVSAGKLMAIGGTSDGIAIADVEIVSVTD